MASSSIHTMKLQMSTLREEGERREGEKACVCVCEREPKRKRERERSNVWRKGAVVRIIFVIRFFHSNAAEFGINN